jgi:hypothetical protein
VPTESGEVTAFRDCTLELEDGVAEVKRRLAAAQIASLPAPEINDLQPNAIMRWVKTILQGGRT